MIAPRPRPSPRLGFTLIEVLVALALFSVMSLLAWRGLDAVLQSRASVEAPGRAALELAAAWTQLETDLHAARAAGAAAPTSTSVPGSAPVLAPAPYVTASANRIALLRAPAPCAGCWQGVVYDIAADGGAGNSLRRRTTAIYSEAGAALAALEALAGNPASAENAPAGATSHVLLRNAGNMRVGAWRLSPEGNNLGGWVALGAAIDSVFPAAVGPSAARTPRPAALKVEWQLGAPWDGWVSKVVLLENRW